MLSEPAPRATGGFRRRAALWNSAGRTIASTMNVGPRCVNSLAVPVQGYAVANAQCLLAKSLTRPRDAMTASNANR